MNALRKWFKSEHPWWILAFICVVIGQHALACVWLLTIVINRLPKHDDEDK